MLVQYGVHYVVMLVQYGVHHVVMLVQYGVYHVVKLVQYGVRQSWENHQTERTLGKVVLWLEKLIPGSQI